MPTDNPWRTLAERLGLWFDWDEAQDDAATHTQDLLIGRALRVARYRWSKTDLPIAEHERRVFLLYLALGNEMKARLAIELLDEVGHQVGAD